jgi:hypothetical protein
MSKSQNEEIIFAPIEFEDPTQKTGLQYTSTIHKLKDGKKIYPNEVTNFMKHKYSSFASAKFNAPEKRNHLKVNINEEEKESVELQNTVEKYYNAFVKDIPKIFGKYAKLYTPVSPIKVPKEADELELEAAKDNDKVKEPKKNSIRFKLPTGWNYYYDDIKLDKDNAQNIRKTIKEALAKNNNDKKIIPDVMITLTLLENGKKNKKILKMSEIEQRNEFLMPVYYRKVTNIDPNAKPIQECTDNDELEQYYGKPEEKIVLSPEDLDLYYGYNCYVRLCYRPVKIWAAKNKDEDGKRKTSIQFVVDQMDIIQVQDNYAATGQTNSIKSLYSGYAFGKNTDITIKDANTVFDQIEKSTEKSTEKSSKKPTKLLSKNISDDEESEDESAEESEAESEEEESEEESEEEEPPKKNTKSKKSIIEEPKKTKSSVKTK